MKYTKQNPLRVVTLCEDTEKWRPIKGYEGLYEISNIGNVKSLARKVSNGHALVDYDERLLKPNVLAKGYLQVTLYNGKSRRGFQVHRLVAEAFIPNNDNMPQVNHKNGNKQDNRTCNLEWTDNKGNQLHAWATGLQKPHYCGGGADKKRRVALLDADGNVEREFESIRAASTFMGCSTPANLSHLLNGKGKIKSVYGRKFRFI